jgi:hypothetical protein
MVYESAIRSWKNTIDDLGLENHQLSEDNAKFKIMYDTIKA